MNQPSQRLQRKLTYALPGMEEARVRANLAYKTVDGRPLLADVYAPPDATPGGRGLPALIFVHGDGPPHLVQAAKDWNEYVAWGRAAAASGMVGVVFNHRSSEDRMSQMGKVSGDVSDLIAYIRGSAAELGIDPQRLGVWAFSAGVPYLQAVLADPPAYLKAVAAYYGMMDLRQFAGPLLEDRIAPERDAILEILQTYSLLHHLERSPAQWPPVLLAQAGLDDEAINETIERFAERARQLGVPVEAHRHPDGEHGFDLLDDDEASRRIIRGTLAFFQKHLLA